MTKHLRLTDLQATAPTIWRLAHGLAYTGSFRRITRRILTIALELTPGLMRDVIHLAKAPSFTPLRMEVGAQSDAGPARISLYVHYSASGRISEMVRFQLRLLGELGFKIVFISMAVNISDDEWEAVKKLCTLVVQRKNFGLDFGAWRDIMPEVRRRWPSLEELMLANDSVLGPIHPLAPLIETMRAGGEGLFGVTESLQGGPHLQSYMLLTRGKSATESLMNFFGDMHISHSKWLVVKLGELRLARWMLQRGYRVAAVFGYERLVDAALCDPNVKRRLAALSPKFEVLNRLPHQAAKEFLFRWPLNPTHHLWDLLTKRFGSPFLKTELVMRNPGQLPNVAAWPDAVPADSPCSVALLKAHLATLNVEGDSPGRAAR